MRTLFVREALLQGYSKKFKLLYAIDMQGHYLKMKPSKTPLSERIAKLQAQLDQKKVRLSQLKAKETAEERRRDARRKIVVGAAVLAHAHIHKDFANQLATILKKAVTRETDIAVISDLIEPPKEK